MARKRTLEDDRNRKRAEYHDPEKAEYREGCLRRSREQAQRKREAKLAMQQALSEDLEPAQDVAQD